MIEAKFKHTDIGLVPEDWEISTFGKEFKKLNAASYTWSETIKDGSCAYLHYGEIHTKYHYHLNVQHSDLPFISKNQAKRFNKLQNGDLIMLNASEDYDGVNDCVEIINCDKELIAGQHTIPLRPISDKLVKGFIGYIPSIPAVRMQLIENAVGTKVYGVTNELLQTVLLPIPTRHEQQRIASALMKVDALISNLDKLIQKKQAIKKGAMQELLTGRKRLPGFNVKWKEIRLGDVAKMNSGGTPDSKNTAYYSGTIPFLSISDMSNCGKFITHTQKHITSEAVANSSARIYPKGTLLYAMYASLGKTSIAKIDLAISQAILGIITDETILDKEYLYYNLCYIESKVIQMGQTGTQSNLSKALVEEFIFTIPEVDEQKAIANVFICVDSEISVLDKKRDKYRHIKQGMMRDLLMGRIRLVETSDMERKSYTVSVQKNLFDGAIAAEPHPD